MATSSEVCALTPKKCFAEESKNVLKWSEKTYIILVALLFFTFRILSSEIIIFWLLLYMEESLAATFSEKRAHTSRNYLTEQGIEL